MDGEEMMRRGYRGVVAAAILGGWAATAGEPVPDIVAFDEAPCLLSRLEGESVVAVPTGTEPEFDRVEILVSVDRHGAVTGARLADEMWASFDDHKKALAAALQWRFKPLTWRGRPVSGLCGPIRVYFEGPVIPPDAQKPFPKLTSNDWSITLERGPSIISRPVYTVTIRGDGSATYLGEAFDGGDISAPFGRYGVLISGRHVGRIAPAEVDHLLKSFRDGGFFGLQDRYIGPYTDQQEATLTFSSGGTKKVVVDYIGEMAGMPPIVTELQDEVDRLFGSRWTTGDGSTAGSLQKEGFDFDSKLAVDLLVTGSLRNAPDEFIIGLIESGVPLEREIVSPNGGGYTKLGLWLVADAARSGRHRLLQRLKALGWLAKVDRRVLATAFASGAGCDEATLKFLLAERVDPAARDDAGDGVIANVAAKCAFIENRVPRLTGLVRLLLEAGAPTDEPGSVGKTPLFHAREFEVIDVLLKAGARADRLAADGSSPLYEYVNDRRILALLEAGAKPHPRQDGVTLRKLAEESGLLPGTVEWLDHHRVQ